MNPSVDRSRYFDHAATTPLDPRVLERMMPYLTEQFGNANSIHRWGSTAHDAVERARVQIAELIQAEDPSQIFFTSGASEANNWVVRLTKHGLYSPFEHSSMREAAQAAEWELWPNRGYELGPPGHQAEVASLMAVNNETGTIWDVRTLGESAGQLHVDATQVVGKLPFSVAELSFASMSAHKLYGPKGVGALFASERPPAAMIVGGEQEQGYRSGTLNVAAIVGFGAAAELAGEEISQNLDHAHRLRDTLIQELETIADWRVLGGPKTSPFILSLSFAGVEGEALVIEADHRGFAMSSGAACSSRSTEPSHVLQALGVSAPDIRGTVRVSFGKDNTLDSCVALARTLAQSVQMLRTMTGAN